MTDSQTVESTAEASTLKAMTDLQRAGLGPLAWMGTAMLENMTALGSEVTQFIADRIREDIRTQHQILHCKDMDELRRIQSDFMQTALEQYTAETGKLAQMSADLMDAAFKGRKA